jgi:hypothetical protein
MVSGGVIEIAATRCGIAMGHGESWRNAFNPLQRFREVIPRFVSRKEDVVFALSDQPICFPHFLIWRPSAVEGEEHRSLIGDIF